MNQAKQILKYTVFILLIPQKLGDCSVVWIVSAINRGTTDEDPWEILKHCVYYMTQAGECKSINFIFTKTDDMDPEEYIRLEVKALY